MLVAEVQQHAQVDSGDREGRNRAGHRRWSAVRDWIAQPLPVLTVVVAARAGETRLGYRLTQGIHVATGIATIPLLLFKLWTVYPNQSAFLRSGRSSTWSSG